MNPKLLFLCLSLVFTSHTKAAPLNLEDALALARKNSLSRQKFESEKLQNDSLNDRGEKYYDSNLSVEISSSTDEGQLSDVSAGDKRYQDKAEIEYSKLFSTGTILKVSTGFEKGEVDYGALASQLSPQSAPRYNPERKALFSFTVSQKLWRNWNTQLIRLQKKIGYGAGDRSQFEMQIDLQKHQHMVESYYWNAISLNEKIRIAKSLVKQSKRFQTSMKKRKNLGRANEIDLADSDARLFENESLLLNLKSQKSQMLTQLRYLIYGNKAPESFKVPEKLPESTKSNLIYRSFPKAKEKVKQSRYDLKLVRTMKEYTFDKVMLAEEKDKADISLFATMQRRGLGSSSQDSIDDINGGKVFSYGLSVDWDIGGSEARQEKLAANYERAKWSQEEQEILNSVYRELDVNYQNLNSLQEQIRLKNRQITSLRKKRNAESRNLRLAKTDDVGLILYDMELSLALVDKVDLTLGKLSREANIRQLLHQYPEAKQ